MGPAALDLSLRAVPLHTAWSAPQARDLLAGRPELLALYGYRFGPDQLPEALAARRAQLWRAPAPAVAAALRGYLEPFGLTPAMEAHLRLLAEPETVVVIGGQQPGWLGGPLYTFLKALTVVAEAARLRRSGIAAVPVFWSATEDDDTAEVASAWLLDRDTPRRVTLSSVTEVESSVGLVRPAAGDLAAAVDGLREALPETAFTPEVLDAVARCWAPGASLGEAFTRWMLHWLGAHGLLVADPMHPPLRALAAPVMAKVLTDPLAPTRLSNEVGARLAALGYPPPTHRPDELCAFYLYHAGRRRRLSWDGQAYRDDRGEAIAAGALAERFAAEPTACSTGLLLRPVVQDYLFNTAMFVVGPGEASYAAQVQPVADHLDIARPLLVPRYSATLVERRVARHLAACELAAEDTWRDLDELVAVVARERLGGDTEARFESARSQVAQALRAVADHVAGIDASLAGAARAAGNRIGHVLDELAEKAQRALRRKDETLRRRLTVAHDHLYPAGGLQERRYGAAGYLATYGPGLVEALLEALGEAGPGVHAVLEIGP